MPDPTRLRTQQPEQEATQTEDRLLLPPAVGGPLTPGAAPSAPIGSGPSLDRLRTAPAQPFEHIPATAEQFSAAISETIYRAATADQTSPFATQQIMGNLRAMASVPEAAYVLSHPEIVDEWQSSLYLNMLDSMLGDVPGTYNHGGDDVLATQRVADFFTEFESVFSHDERDYLTSLLAAVPTAQHLIEEKGLEPSGNGGLWSDFVTGLKVIWNAPEAIRPVLNDPRSQIVSQATLWLRDNNGLNSLEDRADFMAFVTGRAQEQVSEIAANSSGFFALAQKTVGFIPDAWLNQGNDWLVHAKQPDQYATRQYLSLGMNVAAGLGVSPNEDHYNTVSGSADAFAQIFLDPQNLFFNVGQAIKAAGRVPRMVSRGRALGYAANPFGGQRLGLAVMDRSLVSRFTYAAFSKDVETLSNTRKANRAWRWIANTSSPDEIAQRFPAMAGADELLDAMALADNVDEVRELARMGMHGGLTLGVDTPILDARRAAALSGALSGYEAARRGFLDSGGSLGEAIKGLDMVDPGDVYVIADQFDEGVTARGARIGPRLASSPEVLRQSIKDGEVVIRETGGTYAAFVNDEWAGFVEGLASSNPQIAVEPAFRNRGVGSALLQAIGPEGEEALKGADAITGSARGLLGLDFVPVFNRTGELAQDGARKTVVSQAGHESLVRVNLDPNEVIDPDFIAWLDNTGETGRYAAAALAEGQGFGALSDDALQLVAQYGEAKGGHLVYLQGQMVPTRSGRRMLVDGIDGPDTGRRLAQEAAPEIQALNEAALKHQQLAGRLKPQMWFIKDLPDATLTRRARAATSNRNTSNFMQGLRRTGFRLTHQLPRNISLTDAGAGSQALRNWIKAIGGTDELATKWADAFRAGNAATRKDIIMDAMREAGEQLDNPNLKYGLMQFTDKQGHYTYFYDRAGRELGLGGDGSIKPMTLSHFTTDFAMPDAKQVIKSIKRFNQAKSYKSARLRRGLNLTGTRGRRARLADNLKQRMVRAGYADEVAAMDPEDLLSMAYADVLGGEYGRAAGMGAVGKAGQLVGKGYQMFHHVFVVAQLALRPIAWASRVLMEETIRADMFDLPSIWKNPHDYIARVAEASAIRKLPAQLEAQGRVADALVADLFAGDVPDWARIRNVIPDVDARLADLNVDEADVPRARAAVAHIIGRGMVGDSVTEGTLGLRGNITRRALLRDRKIRRTFERMEDMGLARTFRWDHDGLEIANRSFYQNFVTEAEAATIPLEYNLQGMTQKGLATYGRGYGRQMYQMINDPVVGTYGFNRAIDTALGRVSTWNGEKLVASSNWPQLEQLINSRLDADGIVLAGNAAKGDWYLEQIDEIVETLFGPLAQGNIDDKVRILEGLSNNGTARVDVGVSTFNLNAARDNYEGFVRSSSELAEAAYVNGVMLPRKVAAFLDPRFGQAEHRNIYRRMTDWSMKVFGEESTQYINRQPAFLDLHEKYYKHYIELGWGEEASRLAASQKAAELTNHVFFDNSSIPQFLRDMNQAVPFFSAMFEVGSTWLYKIPSQNLLPLGYAQLLRRVSRTLSGLIKSGLVQYDIESGQMQLNVDRNMQNANDPVTRNIGRSLFEYMRLPITMLEYLGGLGSLLDDEEGFTPADLGALSKDGFSLSIGNPLDPTSHGIMAVNQFSIGLSPTLQLPLSMSANAVFAHSDEAMETGGLSVEEFIQSQTEAEEPVNIGTLMRYNQEAFIELNGDELFRRVLNGDAPLNELAMPNVVRLPETSTWETLVDRMFFPFGRLDSFGEVITSVSPAAMNHVWRGLGLQAGVGADSDFAGWLFGEMSNYQVASEILTQIQMLEAGEGLVTKASDLSGEIAALVQELDLEVAKDPSGADIVLDPTHPRAAEVQAKLDKLAHINHQIMKRANDNAAGALISRGIMGQLGPATPRMWDRQQRQMADYWSSKDIALEASANGDPIMAGVLAEGPGINSFEDLSRIANLTNAWLNDPSGDEAKVWVAKQNPGLLAFTQGKTFWGPAGPPPEAAGFDAWVDQIESGEREPFEPEVFMARYQRAALAVDKEIDIIAQYGIDPDAQVQAILNDYNTYKELVEPYDMRYEGLDFIDRYLFDGRYAAWRTKNVDELTTYDLVKFRVQQTADEIDNIVTLLEYTDLSPDEERRIRGILNSTIASHEDAIRQQADLAQGDATFLNPREQVLARYWSDVSNSYYEGRNELFAELPQAENATMRSVVFDAIRMYDNEWFGNNHSIEGADGESLSVPDPLTRTWNGRTQDERQERILKTIGKKPEWLNLFEMQTIINDSPQAARVLPHTIELQEVHDAAAREKYRIIEFARANPDALTGYERDQLLSQIDDRVDEILVESGRVEEYLYRQAVPIQKLEMLGLLPSSLGEVASMTNSVMAQLRAEEKSPTTELGRRHFLWLTDYLEQDLFVRNPQAQHDFDRLGLIMFDEPLRSAVYAKFLQGDYFGELR